MKKNKTIGLLTLGCPKNRTDAERMMFLLMKAGHKIQSLDQGPCDIAIINTCGFIGDAKRESIDAILEAAQRQEDGEVGAIIATGCLTQRYQQELMDSLPEVGAALGVHSCEDILSAVQAVESGEVYTSFRDYNKCSPDGMRILSTPPHMAYIKIAEGCNNRCTYCAIPSIRGPFVSREEDAIIAEAKHLATLGVKELNLVAQDSTAYGSDKGSNLASLLKRLDSEVNIPWIRLLYCYPEKITDELISAMASCSSVVKYIDMPVQHISDNVLKRMNRRGSGEDIRHVIKQLRDAMPNIAIRSTLIVGFPGETEEDFAQLHKFVAEGNFDRLGVFAYSAEEGTPAAEYSDQISTEIAQRRVELLMEAQANVSNLRNGSMVGQVVQVLVEGDGYGRTTADAPDIDGRVNFTSDSKVVAGDFVNVKITGGDDYDLEGEVI